MDGACPRVGQHLRHLGVGFNVAEPPRARQAASDLRETRRRGRRIDSSLSISGWTDRCGSRGSSVTGRPTSSARSAPEEPGRGGSCAYRRRRGVDLDLLLAELLPGDEGWGPALRGSTLVHESSPTSSLADGWDGYLSREARTSASRSAAASATSCGIQASLPARERETLHTDLACCSRSTRALERVGSAFERWQGFHRDFAPLALERGWLRLWFLDLDDRPWRRGTGFGLQASSRTTRRGGIRRTATTPSGSSCSRIRSERRLRTA